MVSTEDHRISREIYISKQSTIIFFTIYTEFKGIENIKFKLYLKRIEHTSVFVLGYCNVVI